MTLEPRAVLRRFAQVARTERALLDHLEQAGFSRVYLPTYAPLEGYADRLGDEVRTEYLTFVFEGEQVLRPEFTTSVCRLVAGSPALRGAEEPLRLAYAGQTFRVHHSAELFPHEQRQVGAELIGPRAASGDAEILRLVTGCVEVAGLSGCTLCLGHVGLLEGVLCAHGVEGATADRVRRDLHRLATHAARLAAREPLMIDVLPRLVQARARRAGLSPAELPDDLAQAERVVVRAEWSLAGLPGELVSLLESLHRASGSLDDVRGFFRAHVGHARSEQALDELAEVLDRAGLASSGEPRDGAGLSVRVDPTASRDIAYYSGLLFDVRAPQGGSPLGGGGRYDGHMAAVAGASLDRPAAGFAFDVGRIAELQLAMEENR